MLQLTIDDCANLIAFGNRAQMAGKEADTWVLLKSKIAAEGQRMVDAKRLKMDVDAAMDKEKTNLKSVPKDG